MKLKGIIICLLILSIGVYGTYKLTKRYDRKYTPYKLLMQSETIDNRGVESLIDKNKPLLVHFWGSWCPDCRKELNIIEKLSKNSDITLITVAQGSGSNKEIKEFMKSRNLDFVVINDKNDKLVTAFKILGYPTTYFYSTNRVLTKIKRAGPMSYDKYLEFINFIKE